MRPFLLILSIVLTFLFISCDPDGPVGTQLADSLLFQSEKSPYRFYGTVVDTNDEPLSQVDVHFLYNTDQQLNKGKAVNNPMPSTKIQFSIPTSGHTTVKVFRMGTRELIATLVDTILPAGNHLITFNAGAVTNGFYIYEIKSVNFFAQKLMPLLLLDMSQLLETTPLVKTDSQGKFSLPIGVFALEEEFIRTNDAGTEFSHYQIGDSIGFVLYRGNGEPTIEWTRINRTSNTEKTFVMK